MAAPMRIHRAWLFTLGLLVSLALLAACAMPLGPSYHLRLETVTARYQPGNSPPLRVLTQVEMVNVGNAPLEELTIRLPQRLQSGTEPAVSINGRQVIPVLKTKEGETRINVPIDPPLAQRGTLPLRLEYEIALASPEFVLDPDAWFGTFAPPKHLFAKGEARAQKTELEIFVPAGYRVLTTGRQRGVRSNLAGGTTEYRFEIRDHDFPPFLLAGKFDERKIRAQGRDVVFWTHKPLDAGCARTIAARLATTANLYRSRFGRLSKSAASIAVIEMSAENGVPAWRAEGFGSVPQGVLFSTGPSEFCKEPQRFYAGAEKALAATWFGWAVAPEPDTRAFLLGGVPRYAMLLAEEGGSPAAARERLVKGWMAEYASLSSHAKPIAPVALKSDSPDAERKMAGIQSALFLIALEDSFGPVAIQHALAHLVSSLRDSTAGLDDVRSALEEATGRNLFELFREWLERPGIPAAFRQRYLAAKREPGNEEQSTLISRRAR
jgi:hypothetical protein